jgi:rifampicin phosphotransferase
MGAPLDSNHTDDLEPQMDHRFRSMERAMSPDGSWFDDSTIDDRFPAWTRGNAADVFPEPFSPLGHSLVLCGGMCTGLRDGYVAIGALDYDEFENPEHPDLFKVFGGYPFNPLTMTRILGARMPGATPEMIDRAFFDDRDEVPPYEHQDWHDSAKHEAKLGASMAWAMSADALPNLDADKALARRLRADRPDLTQLTDSALHARARAMVPYIQQTFENAMIVSSLSALGTGALGAICADLGETTMTIRLLAGIEVDSSAPSHAMWELGRLARQTSVLAVAFEAGAEQVLRQLRASHDPDAAAFVARFEQFLFDHGSRAQNEYDPRSSSWEVKPSIALTAIDLLRRSDERTSPPQRATQRQSPNATASQRRSARGSRPQPRQPVCSKPHSNLPGCSWPDGSEPRRTWCESSTKSGWHCTSMGDALSSVASSVRLSRCSW